MELNALARWVAACILTAEEPKHITVPLVDLRVVWHPAQSLSTLWGSPPYALACTTAVHPGAPRVWTVPSCRGACHGVDTCQGALTTQDDRTAGSPSKDVPGGSLFPHSSPSPIAA